MTAGDASCLTHRQVIQGLKNRRIRCRQWKLKFLFTWRGFLSPSKERLHTAAPDSLHKGNVMICSSWFARGGGNTTTTKLYRVAVDLQEAKGRVSSYFSRVRVYPALIRLACFLCCLNYSSTTPGTRAAALGTAVDGLPILQHLPCLIYFQRLPGYPLISTASSGLFPLVSYPPCSGKLPAPCPPARCPQGGAWS